MAENDFGLSNPQPKPTPNDLPYIADLLQRDLDDRRAFGRSKYPDELQPFNGRNPLVDAYQEVWDDLFYIRQVMYEAQHNAAQVLSIAEQIEHPHVIMPPEKVAEQLREIAERIWPGISRSTSDSLPPGT